MSASMQLINRRAIEIGKMEKRFNEQTTNYYKINYPINVRHNTLLTNLIVQKYLGEVITTIVPAILWVELYDFAREFMRVIISLALWKRNNTRVYNLLN